MSITGSTAMGTPLFDDLKKQASYFLKEKLRSARLALTDVTPAELLTEEATNGSPWAPDAMTMNQISRAAFEIDDYWRIVEILHKRFSKFDRKNWREPYKALILLEHLLTHGPRSISEEFQGDGEVIQEMLNFQYVDEKGFNWGLRVKDKTERVLRLLEKGPLLKEERARARKISRGIQGFGSFNLSWSSTQATKETSYNFERSNTYFEDYKHRKESPDLDCKKERLNSDAGFDAQFKETAETKERDLNKNSSKQRLATEESKQVLTTEKGRKVEHLKEDHPFSNLEHESTSLLLMSHR